MFGVTVGKESGRTSLKEYKKESFISGRIEESKSIIGLTNFMKLLLFLTSRCKNETVFTYFLHFSFVLEPELEPITDLRMRKKLTNPGTLAKFLYFSSCSLKQNQML